MREYVYEHTSGERFTIVTETPDEEVWKEATEICKMRGWNYDRDVRIYTMRQVGPEKKDDFVSIIYTTHTANGLDLLCGIKEPTVMDLLTDYVVVYDGKIDYPVKLDPDSIFRIFNDADYNMRNPLATPEAQEKIGDLNTHTSMSVGDIAVINDVAYLCLVAGWKVLPLPGANTQGKFQDQELNHVRK